MKKFKNWASENLIFIVLSIIIITCLWVVYGSVSSPEVKLWFYKPVSNITCGDVLIIAIIHAYISKTDNK